MFFFLPLVTLVSIFYPTLSRSGEQILISLTATDETLENTLNRITQISGYTIDLQPIDDLTVDGLKVTVHLVNVPFKNAILKIFDKICNHAIIWNDKEKHISITIIELSKQAKTYPSRKNRQDILSGQDIRFEQASRTTDY